MSNETPKPEEKPIADAAEMEKVLAELEASMNKQLELLGEEDYDKFLEIGETTARLLSRATNAKAHITNTCFESIKRIHSLNRQLGLTLTEHSKQMAEQMSKMRSGKNAMKAYTGGM